MYCPSCGVENPAGGKFCIGCGVSLQHRCPSCGHEHYPPLTLTPQKQKEKTQQAVLTWLLKAAERQPVRFDVEDLHWADPSMLEFLSLLIDQAPTTRLLIVLTFRPEFLPLNVQGSKFKVSSTQHLTPSPQAEVEAEACFHKAIEIARKQQVKSFELQAVMSLGQLWQQQGKKEEARHMLAEIYGWFTEGFETKDLQEARALLEELT